MSSFGGGFKGNCSIPNTPHHYVSGPNSRGTLEILWTCLTAVLIATWTVQHLNIPAQKPSKTWKQITLHFFRDGLRKMFWMLVMLMAPELFVGSAVVYWVSARSSKVYMKQFSEEDDVEWTLTHGYFANMGGFVIKFQPDTPTTTVDGTAKDGDQEGSKSEDNANSIQAVVVEDRELTNELSSTSSNLSAIVNPTQQRKRSHFLWMGAGLKTEKDREWFDNFVGHKGMLSGQTCPCLPNHTEAPFHPMTIPEIDAHQVAIWNGQFWVNPRKFYIPFPPTSDAEEGISQNPNAAATNQALIDFTLQPNINFKDVNNIGSCLAALHGTQWALDARQLYLARSLGIIDKLPAFTEEELNDQSKGDFIVKAVAVVQVLYIVVQLIVRKAEGLPSSQLEVMAVAFAGCAVLVYAFSFQRPQDVHVPHYIPAARYPTAQEVLSIAVAGPFQFLPPGTRGHSLIPNLALHYCGDWISSPEGRLLLNTGAPPQILIWGSVLGSTLFGTIHYAATGFQFPTPVEELLWKIASILTFVLPIPLVFNSLNNLQLLERFFGKILDKIMILVLRKESLEKFTAWKIAKGKKVSRALKRFRDSAYLWLLLLVPMTTGIFLYIICRLFLLVESFRSLFFLPVDAFKSTEWGIEIVPHLG